MRSPVFPVKLVGTMFGPFARIFEWDMHSLPAPIALLIPDSLARDPVASIEQCLVNDPARFWTYRLVAHVDWHYHLVGAVALLLCTEAELDLKPLWTTIDGGSWVTPQLVAVAYLMDPSFPVQLKARLEAGCPIFLPELSPVERHAATGPAGTVERKAKLLNSLLAFAPAALDAESLAYVAKLPSTTELRDKDVDSSFGLAEGWFKMIHLRLLERGRNLLPRFKEQQAVR